MVCHPLIPPTPSFTALAELRFQLITNRDIFSGFNLYTHGEGFTRAVMLRGFTCLLQIRLNPQSMESGFILGTKEEGWVFVDFTHQRWKRLGWLDWSDETLLDRLEALKAEGIPENIETERGMCIAENLRGIFGMGHDWILGKEGWRYDMPIPIRTT